MRVIALNTLKSELDTFAITVEISHSRIRIRTAENRGYCTNRKAVFMKLIRLPVSLKHIDVLAAVGLALIFMLPKPAQAQVFKTDKQTWRRR